jgi:site-specific DNA recombinase
MAGTITADIYVRISKRKHRGKRETLGVERQEPVCRAFAEAQGWTIRRVWVDNGVSAHEAKHREHFEEMLADVRAGKVDAIVSWQVDRLLRSVIDASAIVAIAREYGTIVANVGGAIDLTKAAGRKQFYDLANAAEYESALRSERLKLKHNELGEAGAWWGGKWRPFGWQVQAPTKHHDPSDEACTLADDDDCRFGSILELDQGEAALIRGAVTAMIDRGATCSGIAADWNRSRITRPGGGRWQAREVRKLLTSPSLSGRRLWKTVLYPAAWPAIIDIETFERLQLALEHPPPNARRGRGPLPRTYLLSGGLAVCGCEGCGQPLIPHRTNGRRVYRCESTGGGCGKIARHADPIEDYVRDLVLAAFDDPTLGPVLRGRLHAKASDGNGLRALLNERETLRIKQAALENDYFDDVLDRGQFERGQARVQRRLDQLETEIIAAAPKRLPVDLPEGLDALHAAWAKWSIEHRRAVVSFALKQVIVKPVGRGYRFDGDRDLELDWRV